MKHKQFVEHLDSVAITAAIAEAERQSSGQIRVFISRRQVNDVLPAACARFAKLNMQKTAARNAVLIYFAPRAQKYAVVGDTGINNRGGGEVFWQSLVDTTMRPLLQSGAFTEAIVAAVQAVGEQLARHFPRTAGGGANELPDEVETD